LWCAITIASSGDNFPNKAAAWAIMFAARRLRTWIGQLHSRFVTGAFANLVWPMKETVV